MNLKGKIILIALITIIALVGAGFATWTFTTAVDADIDHVSGAAHAAIEANGLQVKSADGSTTISTLYIICDSPSDEGIYWSTTNDSTAAAHKITQVKLIGSVNEDDFDVLDFSTYTGTFTASMTGAPNSTTWVNVPTITLDQDVVSASKNANVEYLYTLPTLTYKAVPSSVAEVEALQTEVNAFDLTITFSFSVDSVA